MLFELSYTSIAIIASVLIAIYFALTRNFKYWSSRGIDGPKPVLLFGTFFDNFFKTIPEIEEQRLAKYGHIYGTYMGTKPWLIVAEPELIKNIMVKDFNIFVNRRDMKTDDPVLDRMISDAKDDDWKHLRSVISPTFSSGKMKKMHKLIEQCVQSLDTKLENMAKNEKEIEMKKLMGNYTMDVIARCAFATYVDTYNDPNNLFIKNAIQIFNGEVWRPVMFLLFRPLMKLLNISVMDSQSTDFFSRAIKEMVKQRKEDKIGGHHDFLQLMLNTQLNVRDNEDIDNNLNDVESHHGMEEKTKLFFNKDKTPFTDNDILANSFIFILAGYETTANLLSHLTYLLAIHPNCQQTLLEEVRRSTDELGNLDYETIIRLPYLDSCISETLRLHNPATMTMRIPSEEYQLGETGITVEKGIPVVIPIYAIHHNPEYYPNPHCFDPSRFMPENRDKLIPYTYLPFGAGPRNCVGMRFALMEAKTAIARLILKYEFIRTENTKIPLKVRKLATLLSPKEITIGVRNRNTE